MKLRCEEVEQITVFLENRPGILADLCAHLSDHRINLRAITVMASTDVGTARMVVDNPELARRTLTDAGVEHASTKCLAIEMPNDPGSFGSIARTLSAAGINIEYVYASTIKSSTHALGVLHVSDLERALALDWKNS